MILFMQYVLPHVARNVAQNTRPSFQFSGGSGNETVSLDTGKPSCFDRSCTNIRSVVLFLLVYSIEFLFFIVEDRAFALV